MSKAPAFQLYASDFYMDTVDWSATEIGVYFRLLMSEWVNGSLENDTERLSRIAGIDHGNFKKLWCRSVGGKFTPNGNGKLINRRLEEVREKQEEYIKSQSQSGLKGIEAKKNKGIFPFNKSTNPSSDPLTDPASEIQALHLLSSSLNNKEKNYKKRKSLLPDEEWLKELQKKECYSHLNIEDQLQKCQTWFETKGITVSRHRFLNWINNPKFNQKDLRGHSLDETDKRIEQAKEAMKKYVRYDRPT